MKLNYSDVLDLGFKREDYTDRVHYKENGWNPFFMTLNLTKKIYLDWDDTTHEIMMVRIDKDSNVLGKIKMESEQQLSDILHFFGKIRKPKSEHLNDEACKELDRKTPDYLDGLSRIIGAC